MTTGVPGATRIDGTGADPATTRTASACVHMADDAGTLEAGKLADLSVVDGGPPAGITLLRQRERIQLVMQGGTVVVDHIAA